MSVKSILLAFRFRFSDSTARDVGTVCNGYTGVSSEAPWELTAIRIPTVVLPEIPVVHKHIFNHQKKHIKKNLISGFSKNTDVYDLTCSGSSGECKSVDGETGHPIFDRLLPRG